VCVCEREAKSRRESGALIQHHKPNLAQGLGLRFWVQGSGFRVEGLRFRVQGAGFGLFGVFDLFGVRVRGGTRVSGFGLRV